MYNFLSFEKIIHVLQNSKNVAQNFDFVFREIAKISPKF